MPTLIENLYSIDAIKSGIKSAIEAKGVDMTSASFADYPSKIGDITTSFVTETLSVSVNGTYYPGQGVDGFSQVVVDVPQSVTGWTDKDIAEVKVNIVNLNNSASYVGSYAFDEHQTLQTVSLPNCTSVWHNAFQSCNNLFEVNLPVCSNIGSNAFTTCSNLSIVYLPECKKIGDYTFQFCGKLEYLDLPKCKTVGGSTIGWCSVLSYVNLPVCSNLGVCALGSAVHLSVISVPMVLYCGNSAFLSAAIEHISLPMCSSLGNNVFRDCKQLVDVTIGTETYKIPGYNSNYFNGTSFLTTGTIYVDQTMYSRWIAANGWSGIASLFVSVGTSDPMLSFSDGSVYGKTRVIYSDVNTFLGIGKTAVTAVELVSCISVFENAFNGYSSISQVSLPVCEHIYQNGFRECYGLETVYMPLCSIINTYGFGGCSSLTQVNLPVCTYLYNDAFAYCSSLSQVNIPMCSYLSSEVFLGCAFSEIDLPVCNYIGSAAFHTCRNLNKVTIHTSDVCVLFSRNVFENTPISSTTISSATGSIYVPASLVDSYKADSVWSWYSSRIFPIPEP